MNRDNGFISRAMQTDGLALFATAPTLDPRDGVQAALPIPGTTESRYQAWRFSVAGAEMFAWMEALALTEARNGAERVSVKWLFDEARRHFKRSANNTWTSHVARDLVFAHHELAALIELREAAA